MRTDTPLQRILFASDLSERAGQAAGRAARLASEAGGQWEALHVMPYVMPPVDSYVEVDRADLEERMHQHARDALREQVAATGEDPDAIELTVTTGTAADVIIAHMEERQCDLLVIGTHGRTTIGDRFLGSTVDRVIRHGHRPTLVVRETASAPYGRVVVATDFSELAADAFNRAITWFGAQRIHLVHVLDTGIYDQLSAAAAEEGALENHYRTEHAARVESLAAFCRTNGVDPEALAGCEVISAYPAEGILETTHRVEADLIMLGTHGHNRVAEMLLGSVAMRVLHTAQRDVLLT
ncbi:MAG: universal stress protein [Pseudomonadota bacterium]